MTSLSNKWSKPQQPGITERIGTMIKPSGVLKQPSKNYRRKLQN